MQMGSRNVNAILSIPEESETIYLEETSIEKDLGMVQ